MGGLLWPVLALVIPRATIPVSGPEEWCSWRDSNYERCNSSLGLMSVLPQCHSTVGTQSIPSVRNQWGSWCPGDSGEWWSFSSCPRSRVVIIWSRLAEPLITLQGEERVCVCSKVTQRRHHLTLCEGMTIDSVPCWNLVHKQRIMVVYNFCIWASGGMHLECGWTFSFIYNGSKQLKKSREYSSFTFIKSYSIEQQKNKVV